LKEKRSDRRWKTLRSLAWLAFFVFISFQIFKYSDEDKNISSATGKHKYAALIRLDGMVAPGKSFSAEQVVPALRKAFADKNAQGVIIDINSPGGTPVQAAIIHDAIIAYKKKYKKKVIVVGEDLLTSGAYYVAVAADEIYVNPNTLTGSIGVIMKGFGFVDLMKKVGVERRVYVDGTQKDRLDPFLPQNPDDVKKVQQVMNEVHQNFIQAVVDGRKGKLKGDPVVLFNGDFWSGSKALELGLVDGVGNLMDVSEKEFKTTHFKEYGGGNEFLKMISGELSSSFDAMIYSYT
jgi:protease-4